MPTVLDLRDGGDHVPALLCGRLGEASRRWKRVATRAARDGNWQAALAEVEMVHVDETPGEIALSRAWGGPHGDNVWACCIVAGVSLAAQARAGDISRSPPAREQWYVQMRDLVLCGMDHFWFCLGVIGLDSAYFPMGTSHDRPEERRAVARTQLEKLLRWWPQICGLDGRMNPRFQSIERWTWRVEPLKLCVDLGMPVERAYAIAELSPIEAEPHLRAFLAGGG